MTDPLSSNEQTLVERLRDCVKVTFSAGLHGVESDCRQAADELDHQRAEIQDLRLQVESLQNRWATRPLSRDDGDALAAENDRLRDALNGLLTALNFRDSGERLFATYGMPAIDAANAAAALLRDGCSPAETKAEPPYPFDALKRAIFTDHDYAWSWQCNLAMPMFDGGMSGEAANEGAACIMEHLFGVNVREFPEWEFRRRDPAQNGKGE